MITGKICITPVAAENGFAWSIGGANLVNFREIGGAAFGGRVTTVADTVTRFGRRAVRERLGAEWITFTRGDLADLSVSCWETENEIASFEWDATSSSY